MSWQWDGNEDAPTLDPSILHHAMVMTSSRWNPSSASSASAWPTSRGSQWPKPAECRSCPGSYQTSSDGDGIGFIPDTARKASTSLEVRDDTLQFGGSSFYQPPNPESSGESDPSANQDRLPAPVLRIVLRYVPTEIVHASEVGVDRDVPLPGPLGELLPDLPEHGRGGEGQRDHQYQKAHIVVLLLPVGEPGRGSLRARQFLVTPTSTSMESRSTERPGRLSYTRRPTTARCRSRPSSRGRDASSATSWRDFRAGPAHRGERELVSPFPRARAPGALARARRRPPPRRPGRRSRGPGRPSDRPIPRFRAFGRPESPARSPSEALSADFPAPADP